MELIDLSDRQLACWQTGEGSPLLFIHGVGTSGELWAEDLAPLARDCRLIVYDRRGYGASSPSPRTWEGHRDDAAALIEALDAAPAVVVGYSGGAIVALDLAVTRPELVAGLVLLDPAFNLKRCMTPEFVRAMLGVRLMRRFAGERRAAARWMRYVSSYPNGGSAFDDKLSPERRERLLANASAVFADADSGYGDHVPDDALGRISAPTTIVGCALSPPFLQRSRARLGDLMPRARSVTLATSGHHVALDARDEMLDVLRQAVRPTAPEPV